MSDGHEPQAIRRSSLADALSFQQLRDELMASPDLAGAVAALYACGYAEGRLDAMRVMPGFEDGAPVAARFAGPGVAILFQPDSFDLSGRFGGSLCPSLEAQLHAASYPASRDPVCIASAGYAAGWYSELLSESILVRETHCMARGDDACRFEARRLADWQRSDDVFVADLLLRLDFDELCERARDAAAELAAGEAGGPGHFDPLSPAAHIWGPVLILPYAGLDDSEDALLSIERDIGVDPVRVVVIDVTGARIEALEASGLARLLDRVESMGVEAILVGLDERDTPPFREDEHGLAMPLRARDLCEGIALGFQLSQAPKGQH
jgi:hypothetical protein